MIPVGSRVLIEQQLTLKKKSNIIKLDGTDERQREQDYSVKFILKSFGSKCPEDTELKIGDEVFLNPYSTPQMMINIKGDIKKQEKEIVNQAIHDYFDIVAKV